MDRNSWRPDLPVSHSSNPAPADDGTAAMIFTVTEHDVLSGRGISISQHAGNERFRALVNSRYDVNYCSSYTLPEKRAVAEDIISHIKALNPPGRFLKRPGGRFNKKGVRGLDGPWVVLSKEECIKKTCQALRDCNRQDRSGYAAAVSVPHDVQYYNQVRSQTGLSKRELAQSVAAQVEASQVQFQPILPPSILLTSQVGKRERGDEDDDDDLNPTPIGETTSSSDHPLMEHPSQWFSQHNSEKPKNAEGTSTPAPNTTPATAATAASSGILSDGTGHTSVSLAHSVHHSGFASNNPPSSGNQQDEHYYDYASEYSPVAASAVSLMASHGLDPAQGEPSDNHSFEDPFVEYDDSKPAAVDHHDFVDPLHLAQMDGSNNSGSGLEHHQYHDDENPLQDFGPPSPLRGHHEDDPLNGHHHDPFGN